MGKLNKTFQRLRRERRQNLADISKKSNISEERLSQLDIDAEFTNAEIAAICDALSISIESFFKESELFPEDSQYLIKFQIEGNPMDSDLYEAISYVESERMNNSYDSKVQGWVHNSFDEAFVVLEIARNMLASWDLVPPFLHRESYLVATLSYLDDHAYIDGSGLPEVCFGSEKPQYYIDDLFGDDDISRDLRDFIDLDDLY